MTCKGACSQRRAEAEGLDATRLNRAVEMAIPFSFLDELVGPLVPAAVPISSSLPLLPPPDPSSMLSTALTHERSEATGRTL